MPLFVCGFFFYSFFLSLFLKYEKTWIKGGGGKKKQRKSNNAYFEAVFNARERETGEGGRGGDEREKDSNHSNEGLSLWGPGVVCPGSLFLAPC